MDELKKYAKELRSKCLNQMDFYTDLRDDDSATFYRGASWYLTDIINKIEEIEKK